MRRRDHWPFWQQVVRQVFVELIAAQCVIAALAIVQALCMS